MGVQLDLPSVSSAGKMWWGQWTLQQYRKISEIQTTLGILATIIILKNNHWTTLDLSLVAISLSMDNNTLLCHDLYKTYGPPSTHENIIIESTENLRYYIYCKPLPCLSAEVWENTSNLSGCAMHGNVLEAPRQNRSHSGDQVMV